MGETPSTRFGLMLASGVVMAAVGFLMVYDELGKDERWSALAGRMIGGPDGQAILLGGLLVAVGAGLVVAAWFQRPRAN